MTNQSERGIARSQLQEVFRREGVNLAFHVQNRLNIPHASLVRSIDLARIGGAAYDPLQMKVILGNLGQLTEVVAGLDPQLLTGLGTTPEEIRDTYPKLIGHIPGTDEADLATGEIAHALRHAEEIVGPAEARELEKDFAHLMAFYFILNPLGIRPGIRLHVDADTKTATIVPVGSHPIMQIDSPSRVIEYGPGVVGFQKIPHEIAQIPQTILIESNSFVTETLLAGAKMYGLSTDYSFEKPSQVIGTSDGMKTASTRLLEEGYEGTVDVVISAKTYAASAEETEAGIQNGYRLLKKGGVFIVQGINEVLAGEISWPEIIELLRRTFKKEASVNQTVSGTVQGETTTAYNAIFVK